MLAKWLVVLAVLCGVCVAVGAGEKKPDRVREVGGRVVIAENSEFVVPYADVTGLRFVRCKAKDTGSMVVVVLGYVTTHGTTSECLVTIEIALSIARKQHAMERGKIVVRVDRPAPGKAVAFEAIGDPIYPEEDRAQWLKDDWRAFYTLSVTVEPCPPRVVDQ